jgi:hypothetical protein
MIVLGWIQEDQTRWKQFVAARVQQIKDVLPAANWHYVRSEDNPADCATRGITMVQLSEHRLWWEGAAGFLLWRIFKNIPTVYYQEPSVEIKKPSVTAALCFNPSPIILELLNRHSFITVVAKAWMLRFIARARGQQHVSNDRHNALLPTEINNAYKLIIKTFQSQEFSKDIMHMPR